MRFLGYFLILVVLWGCKSSTDAEQVGHQTTQLPAMPDVSKTDVASSPEIADSASQVDTTASPFTVDISIKQKGSTEFQVLKSAGKIEQGDELQFQVNIYQPIHLALFLKNKDQEIIQLWPQSDFSELLPKGKVLQLVAGPFERPQAQEYLLCFYDEVNIDAKQLAKWLQTLDNQSLEQKFPITTRSPKVSAPAPSMPPGAGPSLSEMEDDFEAITPLYGMPSIMVVDETQESITLETESGSIQALQIVEEDAGVEEFDEAKVAESSETGEIPESVPESLGKASDPTESPEVVAPVKPPEVVAPAKPPEVVAPVKPPEVVVPVKPPEIVKPIRSPEIATPLKPVNPVNPILAKPSEKPAAQPIQPQYIPPAKLTGHQSGPNTFKARAYIIKLTAS